MKLERRIDDMRNTVYRAVIIRNGAVVLTSLLLLLSTIILLDWIFRFSVSLRLLSCLILVGALIYLVVRYVVPTILFRPSRLDMAHRIGSFIPDDDGRVASAVQFIGRSDDAGDGTESCIGYAERQVSTLTTRHLIRMAPLVVSCLITSMFTLGWILFIIIETQSAVTGFGRIILPTSDASWPSRTVVGSLMEGDEMVHGRDTALLMRARNDTPGDPSGPVRLRFREYFDGSSTPWNEVLLTHQGEGLHERMITPTGERIEFSFSTSDASTPTGTIRVEPTPRVLDASITVSPPGYIDEEPLLYEADGSSNRLDPPPVLEQSSLSLRITSNNTLGIPREPDERRQWLSEVFVSSVPEGIVLKHGEHDPRAFELEWIASGTTDITLLLRDGNGLTGVEPWRLELDVIEDREPIITIAVPDRDISVLPSAVVPIEVVASDDLGIDRIVIEAVVEGDPDSSPSESEWSVSTQPSEPDHVLTTTIDLEEITIDAGETVLVEGYVTDTYRNDGSARTIHAAPRRIEIIDEASFLSSVRSRFDLLQRRVKDLDSIQDRLQRVASSGSWTNQEQREQASLTRSIQDQLSTLDTVESEMRMNRMQDPRIESLLRRSRESITSASAASDSAVDSMGSGDRDGVLGHQSEVRIEFSEIVALLGEDQESWLVERMVDDIIIRQENILTRSGEIRDEFIGLRREDMDSEQTSTIDELAREQRALADSVRDLEESLRDRSDVMESVDPALAESMDDAADLSDRMDVEDRMEDAAEQLSGARMQNAITSQQSVLEALRGVKDELSGDEGVEVEDLVRIFEELEKSIERLVRTQRRELDRFDAAVAGAGFSNLDTRMIRLRTNTLSVGDQARSGGGMSREIVDQLVGAAAAQASAISSLRSDPVAINETRSSEEESLRRLLSALEMSRERMEEVRRQEQSTGQNRLAKVYRDLAEQQADIIEGSISVMDVEGDRRTRFTMRQLASRQEEVRITLSEVVVSNEEVSGNRTFMHVHDRIDDLSGSIITDLRDGRAAPMTIFREQTILNHLVDLADSLEQDDSDERFAESGSGSGSGSGDGQETGSSPTESGAVPPIAELKLLRSLQAGLLDRTRRIESSPDLFGEDRTGIIRDIASQQQTLAELGLGMIETLRESEGKSPEDPPEQPSLMMEPVQRTSTTRKSTGDGLADLDELLGLDGDPEIVPSDDAIDVPEDVPRGLEVLVSAIRGMDRAADRLAVEATGVGTQRIQQEVIDELDRLIETASRQDRNSSGSSEGSETSPGSMDRRQLEPSSPGPSDSGDGRLVMEPERPNLSEPIDELGTEWGVLPDRVRRMLQQGRLDDYSSLYERMTIEYYRRLARESKAGSTDE